MKNQLFLLLVVGCTLLLTSVAGAREIYINNEIGSDENVGAAETPLRTIEVAVKRAGPGDVIHLLPAGAVYRESIGLVDKTGLTIEGNGCTLTGADPLPSDPAHWEQVGDGLHRIHLPRTIEDRHMLVIDGRGETMGRTKFIVNRIRQIEKTEGWEAARQTLISQFPAPEELSDGQFAWEPIDRESGWLYVKGSIEDLEWVTRAQGVYTYGRTHDITIRDLHVRHVLNDGFNLHGDAQNIALYNVSGNECIDNGISPHGACSFTAEDSTFLRNGLGVGNGHLTTTRMTRCTIGDSVLQEVMHVGGQHVLEDCTILASGGPEAIRYVYSHPTLNPKQPQLMKELQMSGKDLDTPPLYIMKNCTVRSVDGQPRAFVIAKGSRAQIRNCTFEGITFQIDPEAKVQIVTSTADGRPLTTENAGTVRPSSPPPTHAGVSYGPHERNILNLWLAKSDAPTPLLIRIHGGGFMAGRPGPPALIDEYLKAGISVASITYRFSTDAPYPAQMHDCARAVQCLRANATRWHLDPTRFAAMGGSAGGGISLWIGFHDDMADPTSDDPVARQSTRLTCMAVNNTQTSYDPLFIREHIPGPGWRAGPLWKLFGQDEPVEDPSDELRALFADASPLNYVSADDPPVRLGYTWNDDDEVTEEGPSIHHPRFGRILKARLDALGIANEYAYGLPSKETMADVRFIAHYLKPESGRP